MDHILCSQHRVINEIFMAISYHVDLAVHNLVYDTDRKVVLSQLGPFVRSIREYKTDDQFLVDTYGKEVVAALRTFQRNN